MAYVLLHNFSFGDRWRSFVEKGVVESTKSYSEISSKIVVELTNRNVGITHRIIGEYTFTLFNN